MNEEKRRRKRTVFSTPKQAEGMIQDLEFMKPAPEKSEQASPMMMKTTSIFMCSRLNKQNKIVIQD